MEIMLPNQPVPASETDMDGCKTLMRQVVEEAGNGGDARTEPGA